MQDRDDFLAWVESSLYRAELALHNGDPQVYRREEGEWRVVHRHGDTLTEPRAERRAR